MKRTCMVLEPVRYLPLMCSLPYEHDGDHAAEMENGTVVATWPRRENERTR